MKNKEILVYTIQHTGTWFLIYLLLTSDEQGIVLTDHMSLNRGLEIDKNIYNNKFSFEDDNYKSLSECIELEKVDKAWASKIFYQFLLPEEKHKNLYVLHNHCRQPYSNLIKNLQQKDSEIPIVSSMRDPLLSLLTLCNREYEDYSLFIRERPYSRYGRVSIHSERFKSILSIKKENIYFLPTDLIIEKKDTVSALFTFCNINPTKKTSLYIEEWQPTNKTKYIDQEVSFFKIKEAIINKDKYYLDTFFKIEFNYMRTRDDLKTKLEELGYRDLSWF
jgi:hypothetical protein